MKRFNDFYLFINWHTLQNSYISSLNRDTKNYSVRYKPVDSQISRFIQKTFEEIDMYFWVHIDLLTCNNLKHKPVHHVFLYQIKNRSRTAPKKDVNELVKLTYAFSRRTKKLISIEHMSTNRIKLICIVFYDSYTQRKIVYMYAYFNVCFEFKCLLVENFIAKPDFKLFQSGTGNYFVYNIMPHFSVNKSKIVIWWLINSIWSREMC
jgi:hypothetical protein